MQVLVVGGEESFVKRTFANHLASHGTEVGWHWSWNMARPKSTLPQKCQGVIIIKDMVSHKLSNAAKALAKDNDLPVAEVQRKFSQAFLILREKGLVESKDAAPNPMKVEQFIRDYIQTNRVGSRLPSAGEVKSAVKSAFGISASAPGGLIRRIGADIVKGSEPTDSLVRSWSVLVIEDRPEYDIPQVVQEVNKHLTEDGYTPLSDTAMKHRVEIARKAMEARWEKPGHQLPKDLALSVSRTKRAWLERSLLATLRDGKDLPSYSDINTEAQKIFGIKMGKSVIHDVRTLVLADYTDEQAEPVVPDPDRSYRGVSGKNIAEGVEQGTAILKEMSPALGAALHIWMAQLDTDPNTLSAGIRAPLAKVFNGKPRAFLAFCYNHLEFDPPLCQVTYTNAYRGITGKNLEPKLLAAMGDYLDVTFRKMPQGERVRRGTLIRPKTPQEIPVLMTRPTLPTLAAATPVATQPTWTPTFRTSDVEPAWFKSKQYSYKGLQDALDFSVAFRDSMSTFSRQALRGWLGSLDVNPAIPNLSAALQDVLKPLSGKPVHFCMVGILCLGGITIKRATLRTAYRLLRGKEASPYADRAPAFHLGYSFSDWEEPDLGVLASGTAAPVNPVVAAAPKKVAVAPKKVAAPKKMSASDTQLVMEWLKSAPISAIRADIKTLDADRSHLISDVTRKAVQELDGKPTAFCYAILQCCPQHPVLQMALRVIYKQAMGKNLESVPLSKAAAVLGVTFRKLTKEERVQMCRRNLKRDVAPKAKVVEPPKVVEPVQGLRIQMQPPEVVEVVEPVAPPVDLKPLEARVEALSAMLIRAAKERDVLADEISDLRGTQKQNRARLTSQCSRMNALVTEQVDLKEENSRLRMNQRDQESQTKRLSSRMDAMVQNMGGQMDTVLSQLRTMGLKVASLAAQAPVDAPTSPDDIAPVPVATLSSDPLDAVTVGSLRAAGWHVSIVPDSKG